ncbi:hypothetical protein GA830_02425 [Mesorhizobium sp. NBSH29]|uniref:phage holin family protein n=1 Tax=Mesorhizobium sp. NBSH29 TaxID=2654249 RepID=UPI0018966700|nr:phage holin family protein [Mesorhizobium sp. NBSH29]QPC85714.1 hypothetical protein GA830_02425 [Mesorhizobium sp. NBSH29]
MLATLLASLASGETVAAVRRLRRTAVAYAVAGVLLLICGGFLVGAGYIWLAQRYGLIEAALIIAGGFFVLAMLVLLVNKVSSGVRRRYAKRRRKSELATIGTAAALAALPSLLRGGKASFLVPPAALIAYLIYRENSSPSRDRDDA